MQTPTSVPPHTHAHTQKHPHKQTWKRRWRFLAGYEITPWSGVMGIAPFPSGVVWIHFCFVYESKLRTIFIDTHRCMCDWYRAISVGSCLNTFYLCIRIKIMYTKFLDTYICMCDWYRTVSVGSCLNIYNVYTCVMHMYEFMYTWICIYTYNTMEWVDSCVRKCIYAYIYMAWCSRRRAVSTRGCPSVLFIFKIYRYGLIWKFVGIHLVIYIHILVRIQIHIHIQIYIYIYIYIYVRHHSVSMRFCLIM